MSEQQPEPGEDLVIRAPAAAAQAAAPVPGDDNPEERLSDGLD